MKILMFCDSSFEEYLSLDPARGLIKDCDFETCTAAELNARLNDCDVFIHPYGGYFPKNAFVSLLGFLSAGKGFISLGGVPARYPCYQDSNGVWHAEREQLSYLRKMDIHSVLDVDCSLIEFNEPNAALPVFDDVSPLNARASCQNLVMVPTKNAYVEREWGSVGSMDARIVPLVFGRNSEGEHRSSPAVLIEHRAGSFAGGRWIVITQPFGCAFSLHRACAFAAAGTRELTLKPTVPFYYSGETPCVTIGAQCMGRPCAWNVDLTVTSPDGEPTARKSLHFEADCPLAQSVLTLPEAKTAGIYTVNAEFASSDGEKQTLTQGFIIESCGSAEPFIPFGTSKDYFTRGDKPEPVLGMTYMCGEHSRAFLHLPNTARWLSDMRNMKRVGVNWLRTGIWCNWRTYMLDDGHMDELVLRSVQAFVECAAFHGLHVTFNFFTFVPESWEGTHPYLDRRSVEAQKRFIALIVGRCSRYDNLDWDLINEPYVQDHPTQTKKSCDTLERAAYIDYLRRKYNNDIRLYTEKTRQDSGAISSFDDLDIPREQDINFTVNDIAAAKNGLVWREYLEFNYHVFEQWMTEMRSLIKSIAPGQMVTVGQDEALHHHRPSPLQFGAELDYNCQHTWWLNDHLVWDTVFSKYPGKPLMVQETGIMYAEQPNSLPRRTEEDLFLLLQKKYAYAFATKCAGAIQWIWNSNYFMNNANESNIGALRCDGSYKKEVDVTKRFAKFFGKVQPFISDCGREKIAVVFPLSNDRSNRVFAQKATMNACTALAYYVNAGFEAVNEDSLEQLTQSDYRLVIIPSPHSFSSAAFKKLLQAAEEKEFAIVFTGPISIDEDYHATSRAEVLGATEDICNLSRWESVSVMGEEFNLRFGDDEQTRAMKEVYSGETFRVVSYGKSRFYLFGVPVELSEDIEKIAAIYRALIERERVELPFSVQRDGNGVFVGCVRWADACMYAAVNESGRKSSVNITDSRSGQTFNLTVPANDVAMIVINASGEQIAVYGD